MRHILILRSWWHSGCQNMHYDLTNLADGAKANEARGIAALPAVPAEDQYHRETAFTKSDAHFGVHHYRSIKQNDFPSCTHGLKRSIKSFISELKRKVNPDKP